MAQATASVVGRKALKIANSYVGKAFESGRNNRGPRVDMFQRADDLPGVGYAWCASFVTYCVERAIGHNIGFAGQASVASWRYWATKRGFIVKRPYAGDLVCFDFRSGAPVDHIGFVDKVLKLGPVMWIRTVEGNTGPAGAVSDPGTGRDGVYKKRRVVRRNKVAFIRLPDKLARKQLP